VNDERAMETCSDVAYMSVPPERSSLINSESKIEHVRGGGNVVLH